jgi:hypothetical protein
MRFIDREEDMDEKKIGREAGSCVLYGVRKVQYCFEECTPFPAALRSCLNYLGQEIRYPYLMAATGAAFRLRWNAHNILTAEKIDDNMGLYHWGGQAAYRAWAERMGDDAEFAAGKDLGERFMCQMDALTMGGEGRAYAAIYLRDVASELKGRGQAELAALAREAATRFDGEFALVQEMMHGCDSNRPWDDLMAELRDAACRRGIGRYASFADGNGLYAR